MKHVFTTKNEMETFALGKKIASLLKTGDILAITGDLGTGKTVLVKGVAAGLSIDGHITSPTFTLVQSYEGPEAALHHFDVYRISDENELFEIGFDEYLYSGDICVIEWADLIRNLIPEKAVRIHLERGKNAPEERKITIEGMGRI